MQHVVRVNEITGDRGASVNGVGERTLGRPGACSRSVECGYLSTLRAHIAVIDHTVVDIVSGDRVLRIDAAGVRSFVEAVPRSLDVEGRDRAVGGTQETMIYAA